MTHGGKSTREGRLDGAGYSAQPLSFPNVIFGQQFSAADARTAQRHLPRIATQAICSAYSGTKFSLARRVISARGLIRFFL
jgi:hypothetical protein